MTAKEAIYLIDQIRDIIIKDPSWLESTTNPVNCAFDMAISALQAQDVPDTNVGSMISRQAAIDIVTGYSGLLNGYVGTPNDTDVYAYARGLLLGIERNLNALQSAQPEILACGEGELTAESDGDCISSGEVHA